MQKAASFSPISRRRQNGILFALMAFEGLIALVALLRIPSEVGAALLFGFSLSRLAVAGAALGGVALLGTAALAEWQQPAWWRRFSAAAARFCASSGRLFGLVAALYTLFLAVAAFLALYASPVSIELVILGSLVERMGLLMAWLELLILQVGLLIFSNPPVADRPRPFLTPLFRAILLGIATPMSVLAL